MRKIFLFSILFIILTAFIKTKMFIEIPKDFQHNTIGELPVVEMMDDGAWAEIDAEENVVASQWCDEQKVMFTCRLKFGQSYDVARRIAKCDSLPNCKEAREEAARGLSLCISHFPSGEGFKYCKDDFLYIPECDGDYNTWLLNYREQ